MVLLKVENLTKKFGGLTAVNRVNYIVERGELSSIIGPNGAGKTTFFNLVAGMLKPSAGKVYFDGKDVSSLPAFERARIGIVKTCQISSVFDGLSVLQNVLLALQLHRIDRKHHFFFSSWKDDELIRQTENILSDVGLLSEKDMMVPGLPPGHKKRLELGMSIALKPKLLLLDEPTAGLMPGEASEVVNLIKKLAKEITVVLVEHKMYVVMGLAKRVSVMHKGQIIADGTPHEIKENELVRNIYLGG